MWATLRTGARAVPPRVRLLLPEIADHLGSASRLSSAMIGSKKLAR